MEVFGGLVKFRSNPDGGYIMELEQPYHGYADGERFTLTPSMLEHCNTAHRHEQDRGICKWCPSWVDHSGDLQPSSFEFGS